MKPFHCLLDKPHLGRFLQGLLPFWGPTGEAERSAFRLLHADSDLATLNFSLINTWTPPKGLLFPQTEALLAYSRQGAADSPEAPCRPAIERAVILGLRPCDARSFAALDGHLIDWAKDAGYSRRRESAVLIGLACTSPGPNCFCESVGGGPFATAGLDALMIDLGAAYLVEILTERAAELFKGAAALREATAADLARAREAEREALARFERSLDPVAARELLEARADEEVWDEAARRCVGCGVCAYFCPTCYCSVVYNDELRGQGRRVRAWTSCQFPKFIHQPTGVNLRPTKASRLQRRLWDKFVEFPERFGEVGCMGCGRCLEACPVDLDMVELVCSLRGKRAACILELGGQSAAPAEG